MSAAAAFIRRDYFVWSSYRMNALVQTGGVALVVLALYVLGQSLGGNSPQLMADYGTNYAGYLFTSIAFADAWGVGFNMPKMLRDAQTSGTLETMLMSRYGVFQILSLSTLFPLLQSMIRLVVYTILAVFVFGLWHHANAISVVAIFVPAVATLACIGLLSAAFTLVVKQGDPIFAVYNLMNAALAGVILPRNLLPPVIQQFSLLLPLTHALEGIRRALQGQDLAAVAPQALALGGMFVVLLPLTVWSLNWALRRSKIDGSLVHY
jgi:ABC-2 type transport system permease protein